MTDEGTVHLASGDVAEGTFGGIPDQLQLGDDHAGESGAAAGWSPAPHP